MASSSSSRTVRIGSIDVGTKNLAFVILDATTSGNHIVHAELVDLSKSRAGGPTVKYSDRTAEFLVRRFVEERHHLFADVDACAIEKQLTRRMLQVQYLLEAVLSPTCKVFQVPAMNVKRMFGTSRGSRAKNKVVAAKKFRTMLDPAALGRLDRQFKKAHHHDIADASLQALYVASRHDALVTRWHKERGEVEPDSDTLHLVGKRNDL